MSTVLNEGLPRPGKGQACPSFLLCQMLLLQGTIKGNNLWEGKGEAEGCFGVYADVLEGSHHAHTHTEVCVPVLVHKDKYSWVSGALLTITSSCLHKMLLCPCQDG